jgi:glutamate synthase (NADPH) large chain
MVSLCKVVSAAEQAADKAIWHHGQADEVTLKKLVEDHHKWTGSLRARHILDHWAESRAKFVKVFPNEYKRALGERAEKALMLASESKAVQAADETLTTIAKARGGDARSKTVPAK